MFQSGGLEAHWSFEGRPKNSSAETRPTAGSGRPLKDFVPHVYQARCRDELILDPFHCAFADPGAGKTAITLETVCELQSQLEINRALIVAPLRVIVTTWPDEVAKWKQFRHLKIHNLHEHMTTEADADLYLINYEALPKLFGKPVQVGKKKVWQPGVWSNWRHRPEMLVIDELTKVKNSQSGRSKTLRRFTGDFARRYGLTGTPAPNGVMDLFGQLLVIDRGEALGTGLTKFRDEYFTATQIGAKGKKFNKYAPHEDAFNRIMDLIRPRVTVLEARDWIDVPEVTILDVPIRLPAKVMEVYERAKKDAFARLESGEEIWAQGGAGTRLKQIASGQVYTGGPLDDKEVVRLHSAKLEALDDLLEEIGKPTLVAYEFTCDGLELAKRYKAPIIRGGTSSAEFTRIKNRWNEGKIPILIVQPQGTSHGLNLQDGGNHCVFYTPPWDLETHIQFIKRLARQGQKEKKVLVHHLTAVDTIDQRVVSVLQDKAATQQDVIAALKKEVVS